MAKFYLNILFSLILFGQTSASIIECNRLYELLPLIEDDTLVVFNINNVLTVSSQDAGSTPWAEEHIAKLMEEGKLTKPHATNLFIPLWHDILVVTDVELFDPDAEAIINHLQKNGVKTLALTNRYTEMAYSTHRNLRSVGIDFTKTSPYSEDCWIDGVDSPSKYIEGIIFNGLINFKGDTLAAFLKHINYKPKKLIYIEDKPRHLLQVEKSILALGIPFIGIHFGALDLQRESYKSELAAQQVKFHFDILDDESARKICCNCKTANTKNVESVQNLPKNIRVIHSIQEIDSQMTTNALLVTELDHVLWSTQGSIGSRLFFKHCMDKYLSLGFSSELARKKTEHLVEKIHRRAQVVLIENESPLFFDQLAARNCWTIGISYRPLNLLTRTSDQANQLKLHFNHPFNNTKNKLEDTGIISSEGLDGQFEELEKKLLGLSVLPSKLVGVSSYVEDLVKLQEIANRSCIPFQGFLFESHQKIFMNDDVLAIELECLDRLLTNTEAKILIEGSSPVK